jgi:hypothetical protein
MAFMGSMKQKITCFFFFFSFILINQVLAQQKFTISGIVRDKQTGELRAQQGNRQRQPTPMGFIR